MSECRAWVFTLGNEVVQGRVINTNAAYLGRRLMLLGFDVRGNISLVDDIELISEFIKYVLDRHAPKVIITSGGLGPTYDDRTLEAVARATGVPLRLNEEALKMVREKYAERNMELTEDRVKMAYLPEGAEPIPNPVGTAPGCWLTVGATIIVSLPGVPRELEAMWEGWVEPRLRNINPGIYLSERKFRVVGVPESAAAPLLKAVLKKYGNVYVKTHPKGHEIRAPMLDVYILASGRSRDAVERLAKSVEDELKKGFTELGGRLLTEERE